MKTRRHGRCGASTRGPVQVLKVRSGWKWNLAPRSEVLMCGASCWPISFDQQTKSFTEAEEDLVIKLHSLLGNRWGLIAGRLPDRTENEVKTYWNSKLKARLLKNGNMHTKKKKMSPHISRTLGRSQVTDASSGTEEDPNVTRALNLDLSISLSTSSLLDVEEKVQANTVDHSPSIDAGNIGRKTLLLFQ